MSNKNNNHSFYREQQKSILGQEKWTAKRIGKLLLTLLKWALWAFLIIATLWGCVNEFIIQTSKNLGQGVEFYQGNDFVYPNTYQAMNTTGYTSSKEVVTSGLGYLDGAEDVEGHDVYTPKNGDTYITDATTPFNIMIINPDLVYNEETQSLEFSTESETPLPNTLFVSAVDAAEAGREVSGAYYNLNSLTYPILTGAFNHDNAVMNLDGVWMNDFTPHAVLSDYFTALVSENITDEEKDYDVNTKIDFAYLLLDQADDGINNSVSKASVSYFEDTLSWYEAEDDVKDYYTNDQLTSVRGALLPTLNFTNADDIINISNWKVVENFDTSYTAKTQSEIDAINDGRDEDDQVANSDEEEIGVAINNKIKIGVNKLAFNSGTGKSNAGEYLALTTEDGSTLEELYVEEFNDAIEITGEGTPITEWPDKTYSVDLNSTILNTGATIYGGSQTIVIPIEKGYPVRINEETQDLIEEWRGPDFNDWDTSTSKNQFGFDVENQMYGWTVLDANTSNEENGYQASVMRTYSDQTQAAGYEDVAIDENHALYADQRRLDWGVVSAETTATTTDMLGGYDVNVAGEAETYTVFDEKIKDMMNADDQWTRMTASTTINGETVEFNYGTKFAGLTSFEQMGIGLSGSDDVFFGTLPQYVVGADNTIVERSILSDSIIPTRQDAWGESRVTFIGWSDWGKAWDVQYGPLYGAFVFPLAQLAMGVGELFHYIQSPWGVIFSIITIVFLTRGLGALLSFKGTSNQMKMQEVQTDVAKIKAKYSKYDLKAEPRMKQKQQMEIMALYRKKEINPMGSLGTIFITMPIFISLWIIISSLPAYKVVFMGKFSWAVSSWYGVFNMGWLFMLYLLVGISVGLVQGISSKLPTWLSNKRKGIKRLDDSTREAQKKQNKTQNIMVGVFVFMGLTVPALFAFYWICSGFFTIILELVKHAWKVHVASEMKKDPNYKTPYAKLFKKA